MADIDEPKAFSFLWKVKNFHLSNLKADQCIKTPEFRVGVLQNTSWQMALVFEGMDDSSFLNCQIVKVPCQHGPVSVTFKWKLSLLSEGGSILFQTKFGATTIRSQEARTFHFLRRDQLGSINTSQNTAVIHCQMVNCPHFYSEGYIRFDLETLSADLEALLASGFRSDFKMYCKGETFNVHKFIILSRWPCFCRTFRIQDMSAQKDLIMTGVEPSTLSAFLSFLYTGKLECDALSMDLCSYMHEHHYSDLLDNFETPASDLEFLTQMKHEWIYLQWELGDYRTWQNTPLNFYRVILLQKIHPNNLVVKFCFEDIDGHEWLKVSLLFTRFSTLKPLLLDGEIALKHKDTVECHRFFHHLLTEDEEWTLPMLVSKNNLHLNEDNNKRVEIRLYICDGTMETQLVSTNTNNASRFKKVSDLRRLMLDLSKSSCTTDLKLKIAGCPYHVHSPVVAARSEKFRELIQQNSEEIEIEGINTQEAVRAFVAYLYTGQLPESNVLTFTQLNAVARKYSLYSLEEDTKVILRRMPIDM